MSPIADAPSNTALYDIDSGIDITRGSPRDNMKKNLGSDIIAGLVLLLLVLKETGKSK